MFRPAARHQLLYLPRIRSIYGSAWRSHFYYYAMIATVRDQHTALPYLYTLYLQHLHAAYRVAGLLPHALSHLPCFYRASSR